MTDVTAGRKNVQIEEIDYRSPISEATWTKIGGGINFINDAQNQIHSFNYNGLTRLFTGVLGADGVFPCLFNMSIVGISIFQRVGGTSSSTIINMEWFNAPASNQGSIFTVKPSLTSAGGNGNYMIYNAITDTTTEIGTGFTAPTMAKTDFDAGDVINCVIDQAMPGAEDLMIMIHHRPR